jgi:hypothetical protein
MNVILNTQLCLKKGILWYILKVQSLVTTSIAYLPHLAICFFIAPLAFVGVTELTPQTFIQIGVILLNVADRTLDHVMADVLDGLSLIILRPINLTWKYRWGLLLLNGQIHYGPSMANLRLTRHPYNPFIRSKFD